MIFFIVEYKCRNPYRNLKNHQIYGNICAIFCNSLTQCVCIQYNGSAFNFYCYEVGRLSEIESVELAKNFMMRDFR